MADKSLVSPLPSQFDAFAVSAPGLEELVAAELESLGVKGTPVDGGVEFSAPRRAIYEANLHLRTASRVLVRLAQFRALSFAELEKRARRIPWETVLTRGQNATLRVTCRKSRLYHSDAVAERLARDLTERLGVQSTTAGVDQGGAEAQAPDTQLIIVRFDHDRCTVSADSSGAHLHQRGYRTSVTSAPMRETLAAALVMASQWDRRSPLLDPFCGSGTIPTEAALMAASIAPGKNREFRFMQWPGFGRSEWEALHADAVRAETRHSAPPIRGSDRSVAAIRAATDNALRAGISDLVQFEKRDAQHVSPGSGAGWIVSNPPYGVRLGDASETRLLLSQLGETLRQRFDGWHVGLLSPTQLERLMGFPLKSRYRTTNGGLRVNMLTGTVSTTRQEAGGGRPRTKRNV